MITPEELQQIADGAELISSELHEYIIKAIVKRIAIRMERGDDYILTATDKWQAEVLQDAGYLLSDVQTAISFYTGLEIAEVKRAFEEAGVRAIEYDSAVYKAVGLESTPLKQSPYLQRILQRNFEKTMGDWINFTGTTADSAQKAFIGACDKAYNLSMTGTVSLTEAYSNAINDICNNGVYVTYPSGHTDTIETATLRAVRTGIGQGCAEITLARMDELKWDVVLVSAHLGARVGDGGQNPTNHAWWQGKFYSKSGKDNRFPPLSVTGYGTGEGLGGYNCRHNIMPGDGENNPFKEWDSEENRKYYDLTQRQRALERRIRKTKRTVAGLQTAVESTQGDAQKRLQEQYEKKAFLLQKQNKAYKDFCEKYDMKPYYDRLKIAGWNRSTASMATAAARRHRKGS